MTMSGCAGRRIAALTALLLAIGSAEARAQQKGAAPHAPPAAQRDSQPAPLPPPVSVRPPVGQRLLPPSRRTPTPAVVKPMSPVSAPPAELTKTAQAEQARVLAARNAAAAGPAIVPPARTAPPPPSGMSANRAAPVVNAAEPAPAGATMRCKDGTYVSAGGAPSEAPCAGRGGVAVRLPAPSRQPPAPAPRRP